MPMIMHSINDIMATQRRDALFIEFPQLHSFDDEARRHAVVARQRHCEWFETMGITWEAVAPRGWIEGDPGIYFLHVKPNDPRITAYTAVFETADGGSLDPDTYQMSLLPYGDWVRSQADRSDG